RALGGAGRDGRPHCFPRLRREQLRHGNHRVRRCRLDGDRWPLRAAAQVVGMTDPSESAAPASVGAGELFLGFLKVGLSGFGGVLPFARRMLVEERALLTEREFTELLSLSQFLPGPNVVNLSIIVGNRFHGPLGSLAALFGLMLMPFLIVIAL